MVIPLWSIGRIHWFIILGLLVIVVLSESGFSGFKDLQEDFIENPSLQRSAMSIE